MDTQTLAWQHWLDQLHDAVRGGCHQEKNRVGESVLDGAGVTMSVVELDPYTTEIDTLIETIRSAPTNHLWERALAGCVRLRELLAREHPEKNLVEAVDALTLQLREWKQGKTKF